MTALTLETSAYPPALLIGLAAGMESPYDVAARYNISSRELDKLMQQTGFRAALDKATEMIAENGLDTEVVAHTVLLELTSKITKDLYDKYTQSATPLDLKVKIANVLYTREAQLRQRVQPVRKDTENAGGGFSININFPDGGNTQLTFTPNFETVQRTEEFAILEHEE